jgi:hypothetical protein
MRIVERGIAQAKSKVVERFRALGQHIAAVCAWFLVVIAGELPNRARESDRKFTTWVPARAAASSLW